MTEAPGLGTQLRHLIASLDGDVQQIYAALGEPFRPRFFPIVQSLLRHGACSVNALAQATRVTQPAATQTLAEMAKLGLITLSPGRDRRERKAELTDEGRRLAERLHPVWDAVESAAVELDAELPSPLSVTLAGALAALERTPFRERVEKGLRHGQA